MYTDDSFPDKELGVELYKELSQLWVAAGMHTRRWLSSVPQLLECVPSADCATEVDLDSSVLLAVKTL